MNDTAYTSWKPEIEVIGEPGFHRNGTAFATKEEAEAAAKDIYSRWMQAKNWRVVQSMEPVNYRWDSEKGLVGV